MPNDSTYYANVVKLIHDYKSLRSQYDSKKAYSDSLIIYIDAIESKLIKTREYLGNKIKESDNYQSLYLKVKDALKEEVIENDRLDRKLKRTRRIGLGVGILAFIVGLLL